MPTDHLKVMGMHCGHCSGRVQEILSKMPGVHAAEVDLEGCSATVHGDGVTSIAQMVAAIEAAGFEAAAASVSSCDDLTIALRVTGMHCSHCSSRVEEVLRAVGGVEEASVSLEEGTATVRGSMSAHALVAAVEGAGFQAEVALPALAIPAAAASSALPPATSTRARAAIGGGSPESAASLGAGAGASAALNNGDSAITYLCVDNMTCNGCRSKVELALSSIDGVTSTSVDLDSKVVEVQGGVQPSALVAALHAVGKAARQIPPEIAAFVAGRSRTTSGNSHGDSDGDNGRDEEQTDLLPRTASARLAGRGKAARAERTLSSTRSAPLLPHEREVTVSIEGATAQRTLTERAPDHDPGHGHALTMTRAPTLLVKV